MPSYRTTNLDTVDGDYGPDVPVTTVSGTVTLFLDPDEGGGPQLVLADPCDQLALAAELLAALNDNLRSITDAPPRHLESRRAELHRLAAESERLLHRWADAAPEPEGRSDGASCPRCTSHLPELHPAVQAGGEVHVCPDPFHSSTEQGRRALRGAGVPL